MSEPELHDRVAVLSGRLGYALAPASDLAPELLQQWNRESANDRFVCVDDEFVYARFFADFGPLNLAQTVRFCREIDERLRDADNGGSTKVGDRETTRSVAHTLVLVSSAHPHKRANAMTLLALYLVMRHGRTPEQAVAPFADLRAPFGFRDAACGICSFFLTALDCARAVHKAMRTGIWSWEAFSVPAYEHLDELHNGDMNWIVPGKILAFSGPQRERVELDGDAQGRQRATLLAPEYAALFRGQLGVRCVVRLNESSTYDRKAFLHAGIKHLDLEFPDGGNPPDEILYKFIRTCERASGAVAVHCTAGLGRTGTMIAAFLIKNLRFTAPEAIAWCRLCRPGSIVGPQQQFLLVKQRELFQLAPSRTADVASRSLAPLTKKQPPLQRIVLRSTTALRGR
ncbi:hypothetical protein PybrP1_012903 [[Pythium] brassicae (nom. inval.)]|nr:hypothetical protein PybrP1_012903 [[Pythium] brassicae (nom. inval.)]